MQHLLENLQLNTACSIIAVIAPPKEEVPYTDLQTHATPLSIQRKENCWGTPPFFLAHHKPHPQHHLAAEKEPLAARILS